MELEQAKVSFIFVIGMMDQVSLLLNAYLANKMHTMLSWCLKDIYLLQTVKYVSDRPT